MHFSFLEQPSVWLGLLVAASPGLDQAALFPCWLDLPVAIHLSRPALVCFGVRLPNHLPRLGQAIPVQLASCSAGFEMGWAPCGGGTDVCGGRIGWSGREVVDCEVRAGLWIERWTAGGQGWMVFSCRGWSSVGQAEIQEMLHSLATDLQKPPACCITF